MATLLPDASARAHTFDGLEFVDGAGWLGVISCDQHVANWGGRLLIDRGIRKILELDASLIAGKVIA